MSSVGVNSQRRRWSWRIVAILVGVALWLMIRSWVSSDGQSLAAVNSVVDPNQPFVNMNSQGKFVSHANHVRPLLRIAPNANATTVRQAIAKYSAAMITSESRQMSSPDAISAGIAAAIQAGTTAYQNALASGASNNTATQAAAQASAQALCESGVTGPLICPVALGIETPVTSGDGKPIKPIPPPPSN